MICYISRENIHLINKTMGNEIILGSANSLIGLLRLIGQNENGVIILETMIDCGCHELNCYPDMILRGKNENCGLSFDMDIFCAPSLRMHKFARLENLTINIHTKKISRDLNFGGVLVQDYGVTFKNVHINLVADEPFEEHCRSFAALFLMHQLSVDDLLSIKVQGAMAVAVKGNGTALARMNVTDANLIVKAQDTKRQTIKKCLVEISGQKGRFIYENETIAENDFVNAYVTLSDGAEIFSSLRNADIQRRPFDLGEGTKRLIVVFRPSVKPVPFLKKRWQWFRNLFHA